MQAPFDIIAVHAAVAYLFSTSGDPIVLGGEREDGLADGAVGRAFQTFGGKDLFPTPRDKAAVVAHAIIASHVFRDGNKRTALASLVLFLDSYDFRLTCTDDELFDTIVALTAHWPPFDGTDPTQVLQVFCDWTRAHTEKKVDVIPSIQWSDFLEKFERLGGRATQNKNSGWILVGPNSNDGGRPGQVNAGIITSSKIDGKVAENFLRKTNIVGPLSYGIDDFMRDRPRQPLIADFLAVMQRLAAYDRQDG